VTTRTDNLLNRHLKFYILKNNLYLSCK